MPLDMAVADDGVQEPGGMMSAIRIGTGSRVAAGVNATTDPILEFLGRWVKWIPAEVIAIYAAAVAQLQPKPDGIPQPPVVSVELWAIALVFTPVIVGVASVLGNATQRVWRIIFSIPAFLVWSSTIPHSAWAKLDVFADNQIIAYVVLAFLSLVFPPIFDRVVGD